MQEDETVIDATVVDEHDTPAPSTALQRREVRMEVIRPLDPQQVVASMREHQELLRAILDPSDWQGAPDAKGSFVKKSGWRKVALAYNLTLERVGELVERDDSGMPRRATYTARAVAPNGRSVEATGHCSFDESRFSGPRGNASKLENDMRATAETRAKNRAISDLIGMGKVSAEEVDAGTAAEGPPHGPGINDETAAKLRRALAYVLACDPLDGAVADVLGKVEKNCGYVSESAYIALGVLCGAVKGQRDNAAPAAEEPPPATAGESQPPLSPPAGSVAMPDIDAGLTDDTKLRIMRTHGCICPNPFTTTETERDAACPINGHGIPF